MEYFSSSDWVKICCGAMPCKASGDPSTVIGMTYVRHRLSRRARSTDWEARFLSKRLKTLVYSRVNTNRHPLLVPYPTCNSLYLFIVYIS